MIRFIVIGVLIAVPVFAHDDPANVIHQLTHRIEVEGASARLLTARAFEFRSIGDDEAAIGDFVAALRDNPKYTPAIHGLAKAQLAQGDFDTAEHVAQTALDLASSPAETAQAHALIARVHEGREDVRAALAEWRRALAFEKPEVDWFLAEAEALRALNRVDEAADALGRARERNKSAAIHRAWIHAALDAGKYEDAEPAIANGLASARWKSSWLLMRAQLHTASGNHEAAQADATAARAEIAARLNPQRPDAYLLADLAVALTILGDHDTANTQLAHAEEIGAAAAHIDHARERIARLQDLRRQQLRLERSSHPSKRDALAGPDLASR